MAFKIVALRQYHLEVNSTVHYKILLDGDLDRLRHSVARYHEDTRCENVKSQITQVLF